MGKSKADEMAFAFLQYIEDWNRLEAEYYRIPSWRYIKQMRNISKRGKLTRNYERRMKEWGLL